MELAAAEAELEAGAEERLRVAVEAAGSEMRVVCRGHCDIDKVHRHSADLQQLVSMSIIPLNPYSFSVEIDLC